jgi:hypothetical protein
MNRCCARAAAVAAALLLLTGSPARADRIDWSYTWSPNDLTLPSDSGASAITLTTLPGSRFGQSGEPIGLPVYVNYVNAPQPVVPLSGPGAAPDTFTHKGYNLNLVVTDTASGEAGIFPLSGEFNGVLSPTEAKVTHTFTGPASQDLRLGGHLYRVAFDLWVPPPYPNNAFPGFLLVTVTADPRVSNNPEPPTAALALLALPALGLARRYRRKGQSEVAPLS